MALDRIGPKNFKQNNTGNGNSISNNNKHKDNNSNSHNKSIGCIIIPCMQALRESFKNICSKYGILTYFKGNRTLKNIFVSAKDKSLMEHKSRMFY